MVHSIGRRDYRSGTSWSVMMVCLVSLWMPGGCGEQPQGDEAASQPSMEREWQVAAEPIATIGAADGDQGGPIFNAISGGVRVSDDRIAIADASLRIWLINDSWEVVREVGGEGAGPGKFREISGMQHIGGDSLVVFDHRLGRMSVFNAEGDYVRSINSSGGPMVKLLGTFDNGLLLARRVLPVPWNQRDVSVRSPMEIVVMDENAGNPEVIATMFDEEAMIIGNGKLRVIPPMGRRPIVQVSGDRVYLAQSDNYAIHVYNSDGVAVGHITAPQERALVTYQDLWEILPPGYAESLAAGDFSGFPEDLYWPVITAMLVDDSGRLWVESGVPANRRPWSGRYTVFDEDGDRLAGVSFSEGFRPLVVDDGVALGVRTNDPGVQTIEVYTVDIEMPSDSN